MSTLITGVNGFLGRQVAAALHALGEKVVGIDLAAPSEKTPWPVLIGDVTDATFIDGLFHMHSLTRILHCGGVSYPHLCNQDPENVFNINVRGTFNLLEAARKKEFHGRIVFISSSSVYGQATEKVSIQKPLEENHVLLASEPHGCSKVMCESLVRSYGKHEGLDIISLRVSIVYGPERTTSCGIIKILKAALSGQPIMLQQGSTLPLPWIHIEDVSDAVLAALKAPKSNIRQADTLAYNVTGPGYPTFKEIAQAVQKLIPHTTIQQTHEHDAYAMNARKMSLAAIRRDLSWEPKVTLEMGIQKLFDSLQA